MRYKIHKELFEKEYESCVTVIKWSRKGFHFGGIDWKYDNDYEGLEASKDFKYSEEHICLLVDGIKKLTIPKRIVISLKEIHDEQFEQKMEQLLK